MGIATLYDRDLHKHSFDDDLATLTNHRAFAESEFAEQLALLGYSREYLCCCLHSRESTVFSCTKLMSLSLSCHTQHVRGTVTKSPGQFKHVIKLLLAGDRNRRRWSEVSNTIMLTI